MPVEVREVAIPASLGTPESTEFERVVELQTEIEVERWGDDRFAYTAPELLALYRDEYLPRRVFAAWDGDRCVGRATVWWEADPAAVRGDIVIEVAPDRRRSGLGSALLERAEAVVHDLGRDVFGMFVDLPIAAAEQPGEGLRAPQGDASIPADLPGVRFAQHHGYTLRQLERQSGLTVAGRLDEFRDAAGRREAEASAYRLVGWVDRTPEDLVESYAAARARMALDVPAGGLTLDEEHWDAARVRAHEDRALEGGRMLLVQAAVAADGSVAGYTELELPPGKPVAYQSDTLVVAAHRGHGLGLRVKLANLVRLIEVAPERTDVYTWNADENEHMLAINVALGFEVRGLSAEWQRG
ncbi:GNAT family N-acetyltransferase [Agromyces endophyticus]|uniref:GNAT family N-acetyltransferase n=1 Tax=Agromyces sp. H17E-10 TaxID=2932244 RepID=UPI001FD35614|nr:GNAT family N-acetyltransferase [Agromyces sp. H17E-10]UOQ88843.1 GNAT family N-acetyltransferase [Agromyces sp. H17E-10]